MCGVVAPLEGARVGQRAGAGCVWAGTGGWERGSEDAGAGERADAGVVVGDETRGVSVGLGLLYFWEGFAGWFIYASPDAVGYEGEFVQSQKYGNGVYATSYIIGRWHLDVFRWWTCGSRA